MSQSGPSILTSHHRGTLCQSLGKDRSASAITLAESIDEISVNTKPGLIPIGQCERSLGCPWKIVHTVPSLHQGCWNPFIALWAGCTCWVVQHVRLVVGSGRVLWRVCEVHQGQIQC